MAKSDIIPEKKPYGLSEDIVDQLNDYLSDGKESEVSALLATLHFSEVAEFIAWTSSSHREQLLTFYGDELSAETLDSLEPAVRLRVIEQLGYQKVAELISVLEVEEVIDILEDLHKHAQEEILAYMPEFTRDAILEGLFIYPDDSVGRLMHKRLVSIPEYWTVGQTIDYLRKTQDLPDDFYEIFTVDPKHCPVGGVLVSRVIRHQRSVVISDIMDRDLKILDTSVDQEDASIIFRQYGLTSAPVTNKNGRLVGVVTIDDMVEVVKEEAEEDIMRLGGVSETDFHSAAYQKATHRFPWLFLSILTAAMAASVIYYFQATIEKMPVLAVLMPIISAIGGNAGTQTLTIVVRALATKELVSVNAGRVLAKEVLASLFNGVGFAIITALVIFFWKDDAVLSLVFASALILNFITAGLLGTLIPIILNKTGADPAIASGVFVTTITDSVGFFSFLGFASYFFGIM